MNRKLVESGAQYFCVVNGLLLPNDRCAAVLLSQPQPHGSKAPASLSLFLERADMQSHVAHPLKSPSVGVHDLFSSIA
ncbi:hypothetical protein T05_11267 [Trichinella murrelli]|uniref:Uncharacterized protein n=1 Tax=Trichinella murrelli TaxID=144512 RepID=A0A0V0U659_9BILA|nr:hypothetical protein T05_11267 [Trichinella murrelli]